MNDSFHQEDVPSAGTVSDVDQNQGVFRDRCYVVARNMLQFRQDKINIFGDSANVFSDPYWDILLNIYVAFCDGKELYRKEATMLDVIPATTGLRVISALEARGLTCCKPHPTNRKKVLDVLTDRGVTLIEACLQKIADPLEDQLTKLHPAGYFAKQELKRINLVKRARRFSR